jgi:hypothetical protein
MMIGKRMIKKDFDGNGRGLFEMFLHWPQEAGVNLQNVSVNVSCMPAENRTYHLSTSTQVIRGACGSVVVKALSYKPEGRGFEA